MSVADLPSELARIAARRSALGGPGLVFAVQRARDLATAAAGRARADGAAAMTASTPFHIASIGKLFTAVLILRLIETGRLDLETRLADTGVFDEDLLSRLGGLENARAITLRHLLTHTSGLKDVHADDGSGTAAELGRAAAPTALVSRFWRSVRAERGGDTFARHRWGGWDATRPRDPMAGTINYFLNNGTTSMTPVGRPGERFHYSDTAFAILAALLETVSSHSYAAQQRDAILEPLGLDATYLAYHDDPTPNARSREADVWMNGVPLLSSGFDLSFDWGGGGQVSTVADLAEFLRALLAGELFGKRSTLEAMLEFTTPTGLAPPRLGIGLAVHRWATPRGRTLVGHSGAWGARLFWHERTDAIVVGTTNQSDDGAWLDEVLDVVERLA